VLGLLADLPRKNCWTIAEHAGDPNPDGMQHLLGRAVWDHDGVRDDVRAYVVEHLGDPDAVLVIDETGDLKKGTTTVGVQPQYTGTAGRVENAQVAVYLVYAGNAGHAMIDRELYVPRGWIADPDRCRAAGIPEQVGFATKPALATLVRVAGRRWTIEERFQTGKGLCGLDHHQVRRWRSWYRWTTLAMLAHAVLVVLAARHRTRHPPSPGLISLTCNEVQHLLATLLARPAEDLGHRLAGRSGDADIRPALAPATTNDKPTDHEAHDHGWRLGWAGGRQAAIPAGSRRVAGWRQRCSPGCRGGTRAGPKRRPTDGRAR